MEQNVVLEMRDISKNFTGVRALSHVDFTLRKGEIHALMGENGAGKSTLIKVLTGVHEFESGSIHMNGENKDIINHSPQEAQANGISTVYQEVNLCPNLTVAENLFIGREPRNKVGMINWKEMNARSAKLLESLNINVPPTQMLDECSVAIQQMIAIARAVDMKCKVLILDEPTSSLDDEEVEKLFVLMRRLREEGVGIIFVTHFLEQVYAVCDRITVLRNGELVGEYETKDLPRVMLVAKMMGKDFDDLADIKGDRKDKKVFSETPVIEAEGIGHKGTIRPFDLKINKGEVIGLTGLLGSGRSELVRSIYGADKADSGTLKVNGKEVKINSPLDAMKLGMAYLPEDRKAEGIIADLSVRENIIIAMQAKKGMFHPMSRKEMEEAADKYIDMLQIKTASRETPIKSLSGGNQQKVILGRWLLTNPEYLILDEPTRGIDIGTKTEIQKIVLDLADQGMAVTFISSEVEEMRLQEVTIRMNKSKLKKITSARLFLPIVCLIAVLLINVIKTPDFFNITIRNGVLYGYVIDVINRASELVILAVGMTLVTAASGGQDISVGAVMAVAAAVCCQILSGGASSVTEYQSSLILAVIAALLAAALCGAFNGFLVAKLNIQPMVATLILYTAGRGIAQLVTNGQITYIRVPSFQMAGGYIGKSPVPTPVLFAIVTVVIVALILKKTALGLYIESVGINGKAARLVGLNSTMIKFLTYVICGVLAGIAGLVASSRIYSADANNIGLNLEMDAILAVALGGNFLGGGKFSLIGSVIGAYTIQALTTTLYAMNVKADQLPVYKAIVVIIIVTLQSDVFKKFVANHRSKKVSVAAEGGQK